AVARPDPTAPPEETLPPPGLSPEASDADTVPPPGFSPEAVAQAVASRRAPQPPPPGHDPAAPDSLPRAFEQLTGVCREIRHLLFSILGLLVALLLASMFRR